MQKKCIFLHIYLHMWKKSSIFVVDLGIVPAITIRYLKSMKELCVFRCQSEGMMFKVYEVSVPTAPHGYYYYLYCGRKRWIKEPFVTAYEAAERAMRACLDIWCGVLDKETL